MLKRRFAHNTNNVCYSIVKPQAVEVGLSVQKRRYIADRQHHKPKHCLHFLTAACSLPLIPPLSE